MIAARPAQRRVALAMAGLALLGLALARAAGGTGPPLYDGICLPPHYLLFGTSPGPSSASQMYRSDQLAGTLELATSESTPQASIIVGAGTFSAPAGATATLSITAVVPPAVKPADGTIDGNVYQVAAHDQAGTALPPAAGHPVTVVLEGTSAGGPNLTLERFDTDHWTGLRTIQSGCGTTFDAATTSLGLFALVAQGSGGGGGSGTQASGSATTVLIVVVAVVLALALIIGATRLSRRRR